MRCDISADGSCGLADDYDWRIPNISELQTIADCTKPNCLDPIFGPTAAPCYWSASTHANDPTIARGVNFNGNLVQFAAKSIMVRARAVRGGR